MPGSPSGACAAPAYPAASVRRAMPPPSARCGGCRPLHPPPLLALCTPVVAAHNRRPSPMHLASTRAHRHGDHISASPRTAAPLLHLCTCAPVRLRASAGLPERDRCAWRPRRRGDGHRGAHGDGAGAAGGRSISGRSISDCRGAARTGGDRHSGAAHVQSVMCVMWYARGPRVLGEQAARRRRPGTGSPQTHQEGLEEAWPHGPCAMPMVVIWPPGRAQACIRPWPALGAQVVSKLTGDSIVCEHMRVTSTPRSGHFLPRD